MDFAEAMNRLHTDPGRSPGELEGIAPAILELSPRCIDCLDTGHVCEVHPDRPFGEISGGHDGERCGTGIPCPRCCSPVPQDGKHPVTEAFTPDWKRSAIHGASGPEVLRVPSHPDLLPSSPPDDDLYWIEG